MGDRLPAGVDPGLFVSKPSDIYVSLIKNGPSLLRALLVTLRVTLQAFAAAVVLGTLIAFMFVQSRAIEAVSLFPYAVLLQVTPVVAIAPLIIILVKNTQLSLTICATLVALFPIISNTTLGLRSVDPGLANYFRMNRAGRFKTLIKLKIPGALPYFFGGLRISSGLALSIGAVVAEFVALAPAASPASGTRRMRDWTLDLLIDIPRMFSCAVLDYLRPSASCCSGAMGFCI